MTGGGAVAPPSLHVKKGPDRGSGRHTTPDGHQRLLNICPADDMKLDCWRKPQKPLQLQEHTQNDLSQIIKTSEAAQSHEVGARGILAILAAAEAHSLWPSVRLLRCPPPMFTLRLASEHRLQHGTLRCSPRDDRLLWQQSNADVLFYS